MAEKPEFVLAGVLMKQQLSSAETGGLLSLFENHSDGPSKTPIHLHNNEDETLYLLQGEMHVIIAANTHSIKAGESIFLPRRVPHQLVNASGESAHYLLLYTPGGFEGFLADGGHQRLNNERVGPPTSEETERLKEAAPRYGIHTAGQLVGRQVLTESRLSSKQIVVLLQN